MVSSIINTQGKTAVFHLAIFVKENCSICIGKQRRYGPVANLKHEIDRVDYLRYFFTGCIFEVEERNLSCGNRTMFSIPTNLGVTKIIDENFYFMFDLNGDMLKYKGIYFRFSLILHYISRILYARHYKPQLVHFYPIFHCGIYCRAVNITGN